MATFYAGKAAIITIGGTTHALSMWSMTIFVEAIDVTNFTSGGFVENIAGLGRVEVTASGPYSDNTAFTVGVDAAIVVSVVTATSFTITLAKCTQAKISTDVKGAAQIEATFASNGTVTLAV